MLKRSFSALYSKKIGLRRLSRNLTLLSLSNWRGKSAGQGEVFAKQFFSAFFLALSFILVGCALGEPPSENDATPPDGYRPIYVKSVAPLPANPTFKPAVTLSRLEIVDANHVRGYVHLTDSMGTYYSGAGKKLFCEVIDVSSEGEQVIKSFNLREVTENDNEPHAIALVMDHSGSMGEERALAVQNAAEKFIKLKKPEDAVAVVKYDNRIGVEIPLSRDVNTLLSGLKKEGLTGYGRMTAILNGTLAGVEEVANATGYKRKAVIMFTDGVDNSSTMSRETLIQRAIASNTMICAVDFGNGIQQGYLEEIAKKTGGTYHHMYLTREFDDVFEDIYRRLRNYYEFEYSPSEFGDHTLKVKICFPNDSASTEAKFSNLPDVGKVALLQVQFDVNKADIKSESQRIIGNVASIMKLYPNMTVEVSGHTDSHNRTSDADYNTKLSQKRADAVKAALIKRGIDEKRIIAVGKGDKEPIADNTTEEGRLKNRRTQFVILKK